MGNSSLAVTFDRYGHLLPNLDEGEDEALSLLRQRAADANPPSTPTAEVIPLR